MLFQTYEFLILMLLVLVGLAVFRQSRRQHEMLLVLSYVFYGWWDVRFLMLILLSSVLDHTAALGISGIKLTARQRIRFSGLVFLAAWLFLGLNWPMVQGNAGPMEVGAFFRPQWAGFGTAIATCMAFIIVGNLFYNICFARSEHVRRKAFVTFSIVGNLGILGFFKYFNFMADNLWGLANLMGFDWTPSQLTVALPVGISFYTFQTMSYTLDVYRGKLEPERSLLRTSLYVAYFPQLVAGPILRPNQFLPHLNKPWRLQGDNLQAGFHLVLVGLVKKVLIADTVAPLANVILNDPVDQPSVVIMLGAALFAVQIYGDFSGYTDIARGVSRMFGIDIPLNFNYPYFSTSIIEFWRRWHISLSSWLRDYLYISLGGNRHGLTRTYVNLMLTMVLGGLWHGASWNFVIWGAYQGVLLCLNRMIRAFLDKHARLNGMLLNRFFTFLRWAVTLYFTLLGWLIFRVQNFDHLLYAMKKFVLFDGSLQLTAIGLGRGTPVLAVGAMAIFSIFHLVSRVRQPWDQQFNRWPLPVLLLIYFLLGMVFFFAWPGTSEPFIYFQF